MKKLLFALLLLSSCYTKNQAIEKFCNKDTIQVTTIIHDTIIVDSIQVDTVFNESIDSVFITKNKIEIKYLKKFGKIYLEGKCKSDTIYYEKKVMFEVPCTTPKLSWYKQLAADYWFILPLILVLLILLSFIRK
jgi:hypothetical protein